MLDGLSGRIWTARCLKEEQKTVVTANSPVKGWIASSFLFDYNYDCKRKIDRYKEKNREREEKERDIERGKKKRRGGGRHTETDW